MGLDRALLDRLNAELAALNQAAVSLDGISDRLRKKMDALSAVSHDMERAFERLQEAQSVFETARALAKAARRDIVQDRTNPELRKPRHGPE
jgi:hypothetical protein